MIENDLKDQFAYINNQTFEEVFRCFNEKFDRYCQHYVDFSALQSEFISDVRVFFH